MAEENGKKLGTPPYVPWKTFSSVLDTLAGFMPDTIDTSIWNNFSGGVRSQLLNAFRFLGLIKEDGTPTPELRKLADDKEGRPALLREILRKSYGDLMKLDLSKATPNSFDAEMRKYGQEGDTHRKAQAFFLLAAKHSGVPLSPLLLKRGSFTSTRPKRKDKGESNGTATPRNTGTPGTPGTGAVAANVRSFQLPGGTVIIVGTDRDAMRMTSEDRKIVFGFLDQLEAYPSPEDDDLDLDDTDE